ncbi:hypothetical protein K445DRAFT_142578 [Daldinia sp. EC12]|nr:hypothetical protein K445DRAFT_142578 [Daldinia sp. EC12]
MPEFEFVNVARPGDVKRHSTKIRRHVMKDIGKARRKPRAKTRGAVPVIGESSSSSTARDRDGDGGSASSSSLRLPSPRADSVLQNLPYPIDMNEERLSLIRYIVDEAKSHYRPFRFTWLTMGLSDTAAWHITLANAASYRKAGQGNMTAEYSCSVEAMKWYTLSLASITKRLADPNEKDSEGLIVAITGFVCHDATLGNFDRFCIHMDGLQKLISKKGGLDSLSSPFLRFMISW